MTAPRWLLRLAGWSPRRERALAEDASRTEREDQEAWLNEDDEAFARAMDAREREPHIVVGENRAGVPYRIRVADLNGRFGHVTGGMGSGKSRAQLAIEAQLVRRIANAAASGRLVSESLLHADWKGESADLLARVVGQAAAELTPAARRRFLERVTYIRFFGPRIPEWNVLRAEPGVPALTQAHALAECFDSVGAALGSRMSPAITQLFALFIEQNVSLVEGRWMLYDLAAMRELAARSSVVDARVWVETRLARESATTLDGLVARTDALMRIESVKAALAGPGSLDLNQMIAPGRITIVSFGDPPLGAEGAVRVLGALFLTRFVWAVFDSRRSRDGFVVGVFDEVQESFTPSTIRALERLTTLGRSLGVGCTYVHQALAQLPPEAAAILDANVSYRLIGRTSERDARASSDWLPKSGRVLRASEPMRRGRRAFEVMSAAEEARHWEQEVTHLARQHFVMAEHPVEFAPQFIRALDCNPPRWDDLPRDIVEAVLSANAGVPREELVARASALEARAAAGLTERMARDGRASRGRRTVRDPLDTPDLLGGDERAPRRRR